MKISPEEIHLSAEQQRQIATLAEKTNTSWQYVLRVALTHLQSTTFGVAESTRRRIPGNGKGKIWMAPDFDEPLEEFKDYM